MITCWKGPRRWQQKSSKISHDNSPPSKVCPFRVSPSRNFFTGAAVIGRKLIGVQAGRMVSGATRVGASNIFLSTSSYGQGSNTNNKLYIIATPCSGDDRSGLPHRIWLSSGFCLDEAYEFLEGLGLLGNTQKGEGGKTTSLNASSLNRLIQSGSHKRGTRTSTSSTTSRPPPVNLSVCGNLHPAKAIALERQQQGSHVAACKERFLFCVDRSTPRHAPRLSCI